MSGFLFLLAIDWVMIKQPQIRGTGVLNGAEDLDFADDITFNFHPSS